MTTRKTYSKEFKLEAVRLAETNGNVSRTARELGIAAGMLRRWKKQLEENEEQAFPGKGHPRDEEMRNSPGSGANFAGSRRRTRS